jgi:hypothetical protein
LRFLKSFFPILGAGLMACADGSAPAEPALFTLTPTSQWSGGEIRIASGLFQPAAGLPTIQADSTVLAPTRIDDTTLSVILPTGLSSVVTFVVKDLLHQWIAGTVKRMGWLDVRLPPMPYGPISPALFPGGPVVVGESAPNSISVWDLRGGTLRSLAGSGGFGYGLGPSYLGEHVRLAMTSSNRMGIWQLWPTIQLVDSLPISTGALRTVAMLGPNAYLLVYSHTLVTTFGGLSRYFPLNSSKYHFALSLAAGRVVVDGYLPYAIPVIDISTGDAAYSIPLREVNAAEFSEDGSHLYVAGSDSTSYDGRTLQRRDAGSGEVLAETKLPGGYRGNGLAVDPGDVTLFVGSDADSLPVVLVYDAATLRLLGRLTVPDTPNARCDLSGCLGEVLYVDESTQSLFLAVDGNFPTWTLPIHRFALLSP